LPKKETGSILLEVQKAVHEDRRNAYGHPLDNFCTTAALWNAYLRQKYLEPFTLSYEDVGVLMILLKVAREANYASRDNLTDIAGYAETIALANHEKEKRECE